MIPATQTLTECRLMRGKRRFAAVLLAILVVLVSGCDGPVIAQDRVSQLFEDSVGGATAALGERDAQASVAFEWHESPVGGCEFARYARWRITDYAAADQALREIARLGTEAGLKMHTLDGTEEFRPPLYEEGTATWKDNPDPHYRTVHDFYLYTEQAPELHLSAQTLMMGVPPDGTIDLADWDPGLALYSIADFPIGPDWFELIVCRR
jgi:hypothetical protein